MNAARTTAASAAARYRHADDGLRVPLIPTRPGFTFDMSPEERATMVEHAGYWKALADQGSVLAFGPVDDPAGPYGIGIVLAEDLAEVEHLRDGDPAVRSGHGFRAEIAPMLALVTPTARYDAPRP